MYQKSKDNKCKNACPSVSLSIHRNEIFSKELNHTEQSDSSNYTYVLLLVVEYALALIINIS